MAKRPAATPHRQRQAIIDRICGEIHSGRLQPGTQLPPRVELAQAYGTTGLTIQRAFNQLIEDGHLETLPRQGTFVAAAPPNLHRIGVVYHARRGDRGWRGLDAALDALVTDPALEAPYEFVTYDGIEVDRVARERLIDDLDAHRVMGLLCAVDPRGLGESRLFKRPATPLVAIKAPDPERMIPTIAFQTPRLLPRMLDHLADNGCRRVALVCHAQTGAGQIDAFIAASAERDLRTDPCWIQACPLDQPRWAANLTRLLLRASGDDRPDGLVVTDDTLLDAVVTGVQHSGCRVSEDLRIVSYANFPLPHVDALPVKRMGFDMGTVLSAGIQALEQPRFGPLDDPIIDIPCAFDDERELAATAVSLTIPTASGGIP